jgi:hypothetical protein
LVAVGGTGVAVGVAPQAAARLPAAAIPLNFRNARREMNVLARIPFSFLILILPRYRTRDSLAQCEVHMLP